MSELEQARLVDFSQSIASEASADLLPALDKPLPSYIQERFTDLERLLSLDPDRVRRILSRPPEYPEQREDYSRVLNWHLSLPGIKSTGNKG